MGTRAGAEWHNLVAARRRAWLRMRVEVCGVLCRKPVASAVDAVLAATLRLGEEAAAELAIIPDTPELRQSDAALLGGDGTTTGLATQMHGLVEAYRDGRPLDLFTASPTELLACCIARTGSRLACVWL